MRTAFSLAALAALLTAATPVRATGSVNVVTAENFYGDVARQIGGDGVNVTSILSNPDQDPHLFEASPSAARAISAARIVVYNGAGYDPWMARLLEATKAPDRKTIMVAELVGKKPGDNPHIWYDPATMQAFASALAMGLSSVDPAHQADYLRNLTRFEQSMQPIHTRITSLRTRLAGTPVTATEPVFGYMFEALGMQVRNLPFQIAVMNDTEPGASQVAAFESDIKTHQVRLLVYNSQASGPIANRMRKLAQASGIPTVAVTETEPAGTTYQAWMQTQLEAIGRAVPQGATGRDLPQAPR
jgi:zinc/manganese transport system substrate-binding protein